MKLKIAICDDTKQDIDNLTNILEDYEYNNKRDIDIDIFHSGDELLERYESPSVDFQLVFLDIEMPGESGIDVAQKIKNKYGHKVNIVFVSNYPEYMQDSFKVHPYHFLQKPVSKDQIDKLMKDVFRDIVLSNTYITVVDDFGKSYTVDIADIYAIQTIDAKKRLLSFEYKNSKQEARGILIEWYDKLKDYAFCLLSRSAMVNLAHIHCINEDEILLDNGEKLWVSKKNKKVL